MLDTDDPNPIMESLPTFSTPISQRQDPPLPTVDDQDPTADPETPPATTPRPGLLGRLGLPALKPATLDDTRTPSSSQAGSKPDVETAGKLLVGLLGLAVAGAAWYVRSATSRRRRLRRPTDDELAAIAQPLARIGLRHIPAEVFHRDLADGLQTGSALGNYLTAGPLTHYVAAEPPLPPREES